MSKWTAGKRNHRHNWKVKHVGTFKTYEASKKRIAIRHAAGLWRVTGGESPHWVKRMDDDLPIFECDCPGFDYAKDHACTHVICVMRAIGLPLTKTAQ